MEFTKRGKVQIVALVEINAEILSEIGSTRKEAVYNLADKLGYCKFGNKGEDESHKFCCIDCGSRFNKEIAFKLHQNIKCRV